MNDKEEVRHMKLQTSLKKGLHWRFLVVVVAVVAILLSLIPLGANATEASSTGFLAVAAQEFRLSGEKSANNAKIFWSNVNGATSFTIYRVEGSTRTQIGTTIGHMWDDYGLKAGMKYAYEVVADPGSASAVSNTVIPFTPTNITRSMSNINGEVPASDESDELPDAASSVNSTGRPAWFTSPNCPADARPYKSKYAWVNATYKSTGKPYVYLQHKSWWAYDRVENGKTVTHHCYDSRWTPTLNTDGQVWKIDNAQYNTGNHNVINPQTHNSIAAARIVPSSGSSAPSGTGIVELDSVEPVVISYQVKDFGGLDLRDVFLFADGTDAYLVGAANNQQDTGIVKLNKQWTDVDSSAKPVVTAKGEQGEAPYVFKRDGLYYLTTSRSAWNNPSQAKYQWSKSMLSGWSSTVEIGDTSTYDTQHYKVRTDYGTKRTTYTSKGIHWGAGAYRNPHTPLGTIQREFPIAVNGTFMAFGWYQDIDVDSEYGAVPVQSSRLISLGRPVADSSSKSVPALTDGDSSTSSTYAEEQDPPYAVTVDLGGKTAVSEIDFATMLNVYHQATFNYKIEYSLDGKTFSSCVADDNNTYIGFVPHVLPQPITARYVRLTITGIKDNLIARKEEKALRGLHEILVYGDRQGDATTPTFQGVKDSTIAVGDVFDPLAGITANDDTDGDVTKSIKVSGKVDTSKSGTYTLTYIVSDAAGNTATAKRTVTVTTVAVPVSSVSLSGSGVVSGKASMQTQTTLQLKTEVLPANATDKKVTWKSSDMSVATVTDAGLVKAVKAGTTKITAQAGGKTTTVTITVKAPAAHISTLAVRRGNTYYASNQLNGGGKQITFQRGLPNDQVLVGDWDGDGKDTLAVRRGNTYYASNQLNGGGKQITFQRGLPNDQVLAGKWF